MRVNKSARETEVRPRRVPMAFRYPETRIEILDTFRREDGHTDMTPVLQDAADFYIYMRLRFGRDAVSSELGSDSFEAALNGTGSGSRRPSETRG
jgi:hypothetical protein